MQDIQPLKFNIAHHKLQSEKAFETLMNNNK